MQQNHTDRMTFENKGRYYTIEGKRYEWRWVDTICGLYEMEEADAVPVECIPKQGDIRDTYSVYSIYLDEPASQAD